jgi:uncharacterized protein YhbP (UPF0306 family)
MNNEEKIKKIIKLVREQFFFILCTQGEGQPYGSLIAYAFQDDLKKFFFATSKNTRKYKLLSKCPKVAVVIDGRCKNQDEFMKIDVLTATGNAMQLAKTEKDFKKDISLLKNRHPYLNKFLESNNTVLFCLDVENYIYVTHFQEVFEWKP